MAAVGYPTLGEVLKFAFDAFGVLPRKYEEVAIFDETKKKSIQTALARLAKEEGQFDENVGNLVATFSHLICGVLPPREFMAFGDVFFDLWEIYRDDLRTEGTYLSKSETIKWQILQRAVPRLSISIAKSLQRYNVAADEHQFPDEDFWYLPQRNGEKWSWPLERAMRWAHTMAGCSALRFHIPSDADAEALNKNLDSAKNWLAGRTIPSWTSLLKNFDQSFDALERYHTSRGTQTLSDKQKVSIRTVLFLARAATYISKQVQEHFGDAVLKEACNRFRLVAERTTDNKELICACVEGLIAQENIPQSEWDKVWFDVVTDHWKQLAQVQAQVGRALSSGQFTGDDAMEVCRQFGRLAILQLECPDALAAPHAIPDGFAELLVEGLDLQKSKELSLVSINVYSDRLEGSGLADTLAWIVPWLRGTYFYREERYVEAFPFIQDAYERAQYCAGANQYKLVNRYIELCAKNGKRKEFNQGIRWAGYLGIEVRWLRKDPATPENLDFVFTVMERAVYPNE